MMSPPIDGLRAMKQPTSPLPAAPAPALRRSGWGLRVLFLALFAGMAATAVTVTVLVAGTVLSLAGTRAAPLAPAPTPAAAAALGTPPPSQDDVNVWEKHGPINVVLLGLDADDCGRSTSLAQRTDTMILVRADPQTRRVAMLSIARDLYVYIDDVHGAAKITTANVYGTQFENGTPVPGSGPNLVKKVIQRSLDLPVHRYVVVDFRGFEQIVDALDGIDVDVPPSADDPTVGLVDSHYPDGQCGTMTITFLPGRQHMDGARALQYARSRYSTSDFDRSRRQMQVLMAIRERATSLGVILDLPRLLPAVSKAVDTDLTPEEIFSLAPLGRGLNPADILTFQIDDTVANPGYVMVGSSEQWVLQLDPAAYAPLRERFLALEPPPTPTPEATAVPPSGGAAPAP